MCGTGRPGSDCRLPNVSGNDAEAVGGAFLGAIEQQLHAEADAEHRLLAASASACRAPRCAGAPWRLRRAHAGQDHARRALDDRRDRS